MINVPNKPAGRVNTIVSTVSVAAAVTLTALATIAKPILHPIVMRLNFDIGHWTALVWRFPTWAVFVVSTLAIGVVLSKEIFMHSKRGRVSTAGLTLGLVIAVTAVYASGLLRPFTLLERQMQIADQSAVSGNR